MGSEPMDELAARRELQRLARERAANAGKLIERMTALLSGQKPPIGDIVCTHPGCAERLVFVDGETVEVFHDGGQVMNVKGWRFDVAEDSHLCPRHAQERDEGGPTLW